MADEERPQNAASSPPVQPYEVSSSNGTAPLCQGELVSNLLVPFRDVVESTNRSSPIVKRERVPYALILSQDCDLIFDFEARFGDGPAHKKLHSVLFVVAEPPSDRQNPDPDTKSVKRMKTLKQNGNERYHYLSAIAPEFDTLGEGPLELFVDFKRFFSVRSDDVYDQLGHDARRRCRLKDEYKRELVYRFFQFHSRVAVPIPHSHLAEQAELSAGTQPRALPVDTESGRPSKKTVSKPVGRFD